MIVRDRMHALLLKRGPMLSKEVAAALDTSHGMASNAGRELVAAGRATHAGPGAPWIAIPAAADPDPTIEGWAPTAKKSLARLEGLHETICTLPLKQQAVIIDGTPLDEARMGAIVKALAPFPEAALAVSAALREVV